MKVFLFATFLACAIAMPTHQTNASKPTLELFFGSE